MPPRPARAIHLQVPTNGANHGANPFTPADFDRDGNLNTENDVTTRRFLHDHAALHQSLRFLARLWENDVALWVAV